MKKHNLLFITAVAALFSACSNEEAVNVQPNENNAPQIIATVGESAETRAGVVEENPDYVLQGEKFYWSNGDATNVFFKGATQTNPTQYVKGAYTATAANGNSASFNHNGGVSLANGTYTAYGIFPVAAWNLDPASADFLKVTVPATQTQTAANSTHLSAYLPLKAQNEVVVDGSTPAHLTYKQLAAVARILIWNNSGNANLKLKSISVTAASNQQLFGVTGKLASLDATSITVNDAERVSKITLNLTGDAQNFAAKDGKQLCEGYVALLPTIQASGDALVQLVLTDGTNDYTVNRGIPVEVLNAMQQSQGKSYHMRYKIEGADLAGNGPEILKHDWHNGDGFTNFVGTNTTELSFTLSSPWSDSNLRMAVFSKDLPANATKLRFKYKSDRAVALASNGWGLRVALTTSPNNGAAAGAFGVKVGGVAPADLPASADIVQTDVWTDFEIDLTTARTQHPNWGKAGVDYIQFKFGEGFTPNATAGTPGASMQIKDMRIEE